MTNQNANTKLVYTTILATLPEFDGTSNEIRIKRTKKIFWQNEMMKMNEFFFLGKIIVNET